MYIKRKYQFDTIFRAFFLILNVIKFRASKEIQTKISDPVYYLVTNEHRTKLYSEIVLVLSPKHLLKNYSQISRRNFHPRLYQNIGSRNPPLKTLRKFPKVISQNLLRKCFFQILSYFCKKKKLLNSL